MITRRFL